MAEQKDPWAVNLSVKLKEWCSANGYTVRLYLGRELGIPDKVWNHILRADMICADVEVYAKIYHRTGLSESEPRTVPPQRVGSGRKVRAWTTKQLQSWLNKQGVTVSVASEAKREPEEVRQTTTTSPPPAQPTLGYAIDGLISNFAQQIGREMVTTMAVELKGVVHESVKEEVRKQIEPILAAFEAMPTVQPNHKKSSKSVSSLALELRNALGVFASGSPDDRDELMKKHGDALLALTSLAYTLTKGKEERERLLASTLAFPELTKG